MRAGSSLKDRYGLPRWKWLVRSMACTTLRKLRRMRSSSRLSTASMVSAIAPAFAATASSARRVEAHHEQLDEVVGDLRVRVERLLHVGVGERRAGLAQIARGRAQHGD